MVIVAMADDQSIDVLYGRTRHFVSVFVRDVRLALGGVSHRPHRALTAEGLLRGGPATAESFTAAIEAELAASEPGSDNAYKIPMLTRTVTAVLEDLAEGRAR